MDVSNYVKKPLKLHKKPV